MEMLELSWQTLEDGTKEGVGLLEQVRFTIHEKPWGQPSTEECPGEGPLSITKTLTSAGQGQW